MPQIGKIRTLSLFSSAFSKPIRSRWIFVVVFLLFSANLAWHFPGKMAPDSIAQYNQAISGEYSDWHPPVMAFVWSFLLRISDGPQLLLILHLFCYWLGFGVIVLSGVSIGKGAAVGAGSVVISDIPDNAIAVGNPARVVKMRKDL